LTMACWQRIVTDQNQDGEGVGLKMVARYFLVFAIPLLASWLLFYGSFPLRAEAHQLSHEFLSLALSSNEEDKEAAFTTLKKGEQTKVIKMVEYLAILTILLASLICALVVPPNLPSKRKLKLLTATVVGLSAAKLTIGFGFLNWLDFGKASAAGLVLAGAVVWLRSAVMHQANR